MKFEFSRQIFEKFLNIKFHENPSDVYSMRSDGWTGGDRQTDMTKLKVAFLQFCEVPKTS